MKKKEKDLTTFYMEQTIDDNRYFEEDTDEVAPANTPVVYLSNKLNEIRDSVDRADLDSLMQTYFTLCCDALQLCLDYLNRQPLNNITRSSRLQMESKGTNGRRKKQTRRGRSVSKTKTKTKKRITRGAGVYNWLNDKKKAWDTWLLQRKETALEENRQLEEIKTKGCISDNQMQTRRKCKGYWYYFMNMKPCNKFNKESAGITEICNQEFFKIKSDIENLFHTLSGIILSLGLSKVQPYVERLESILSTSNQTTYINYMVSLEAIILSIVALQLSPEKQEALENKVSEIEEDQINELEQKVQESKLELDSLEKEVSEIQQESENASKETQTENEDDKLLLQQSEIKIKRLKDKLFVTERKIRRFNNQLSVNYPDQMRKRIEKVDKEIERVRDETSTAETQLKRCQQKMLEELGIDLAKGFKRKRTKGKGKRTRKATSKSMRKISPK
jgi:hypothetical protein